MVEAWHALLGRAAQGCPGLSPLIANLCRTVQVADVQVSNMLAVICVLSVVRCAGRTQVHGQGQACAAGGNAALARLRLTPLSACLAERHDADLMDLYRVLCRLVLRHTPDAAVGCPA